jgi:hypothetical protein
MGSGIALLVTDARCGSLGFLETGVSRSSYCKALNFPSRPSSLSSVLLVALIFALPAIVAVAGAMTARRASGQLPLRRTTILCCTGVAVSFILIALAHARYLGVD